MSGALRKLGWPVLLALGILCAPSQDLVADESAAAVLQDLQHRLEAVERENQDLQEQLAKSRTTTSPSAVHPAAPIDPQLDLSRRVDEAVSKRLAEEKKKQEEKEREEREKKEAESKRKELEGYEVGKHLDMTATWNHGLWLSSPDASFRFHIGGRVDFDNVVFTHDPNMVFGGDDATGLNDGSDFRRMRLRADGSFWENTDFVFEINFANFQDFSNADQDIVVGSVGLTDVNVTFRELPCVGNLRIGHLAPPISLEHVTSSNFLYYMERSPGFDAFINRFDYANGLTVFDSHLDDRATLAAALLRTGSRTVNPFGAGAGDGEYGFACRGTLLPFATDDNRQLLHLGLSYMQRVLDEKSTSPGDRALLRGGASRSEIPNIMQTGRFFGPDGSYYLVGELALINGPFSLSSEYLLSYTPDVFASRTDAGVYSDPRGDALFHGGYVEAGLFVTAGDARRYNRKVGVFDRTIPVQNGYVVRSEDCQPIFGRGAVQLTARYSYLDLSSGNPVLSPSQGARAGIEHDITLGVNWYLNPQAVVMLNCIHTHVNSVAPGRSGSLDGVGMRIHFDF